LREEDRCVVGLGPVDRSSGAVAYEEGVEPNVVFELLIGVRGHTQGDDINDLRIQKCLGLLLDEIKERPDQKLRLTAACAHKDPVSRANSLEDKPLLISKLARPSLLYILPIDFAHPTGCAFSHLTATILDQCL